MMAGLYVHIPFCKSRCIYCDFYSTTHLEWRDGYVESLIREMDQRRNDWHYDTLYIGGGTPSQLTHSQLSSLVSRLYSTFDIDKDAEFTIEMNPDDVASRLDEGMVRRSDDRTTINRVSLGIQTFDDQRLQFLHRRHNAETARQAVRRLQDNGIRNISIDLMFGFPGETLDDWRRDIDEALALGVQHISAYSLMYEKGTQLTSMMEKGEITEIDEEGAVAMYCELCERLISAGYEHYEISNFARPGFRSRHNSNYWNATPYLGLGAGAHSFEGNVRSWNGTMTCGGHYSKAGEEHLSDTDRYNEMIMTRLRTTEGIDLGEVEQKFGKSVLEHLLNSIIFHEQKGNIIHQNTSVALPMGVFGSFDKVFISNQVMVDLMI